jgi:hypothetical protein
MMSILLLIGDVCRHSFAWASVQKVPARSSDTCKLLRAGGVKAVACKVLPVSAEFVDKWLVETARELLPSQPIVWVQPHCVPSQLTAHILTPPGLFVARLTVKEVLMSAGALWCRQHSGALQT